MKKIFTLFAAMLVAFAVNATTYTVAGALDDVDAGNLDDALLGKTWKADLAANDLIYDAESGLYVWSKWFTATANQKLSFKVVEDHGWTTSYPASNMDFNFPSSAGRYLVEITFNSSSYAINVYTHSPQLTLASNITHIVAGAGETMTLTASPKYFEGETITYAYSYKKEGDVDFASIDGTSASTTVTSPTVAGNYTYKVVATSELSEVVEATVQVRVASSWTIAGDAALTGSNWDFANSDYDMVYQAGTNGIFKLTKENIYITNGTTLYYKAYINHVNNADQYPSSSNQNYYFGSGTGFYNITYTLDWPNNSISAEATYVSPNIVHLSCDFNGWTPLAMEYDAESGTYSQSIHLSPAETATEFVIYDETSSVVVYKNTGDPMSRWNCTGWGFSTGVSVDNARIDVDVEGDYVFTYNPSGHLVSVTFPKYTRTVSSTNYITVCLPYEVTLTHATAYQVIHKDAEKITIQSVDYPLPAATPYILKPDAVDVTIEGTFTSNSAKVTTPVNNGVLRGHMSATPLVLAGDANNYILKNNKVMLVGTGEVGQQVTVGQYRGYMVITGNFAPDHFRIVEGEENATNIEEVNGNEQVVKFIKNGQIYILRDGITYDIMGKMIK